MDGDVDDIRVRQASGYPAYDDALQAAVEGWKYRPYTVDGEAVRVCTQIRFLYRRS